MDAAAVIAVAALFLMLGAGAGIVHFGAIARDAEWLVRGGPAIRAVVLRIGRLVLTGAVLVLAARQGWVVLLAAVIGFMAARHHMIRRLGPAR